jgi:MarR family 2-MHQ and catechol resistance regulon transcriptional repressor
MAAPMMLSVMLIERLFPAHVAAIVAELSALTAEEQETLGRLCRTLGRHKSEIGR